MPIWRLQCSFGADSGLARDRLMINPHFNDGGVGSDPQGLCEDLALELFNWASGHHEVTVKAYDAQGAVPVFPQGDAVQGNGLYPESGSPREVAVCLSYFSQRNRKRYRGRLYLPFVVMGYTSPNAARPPLGVRTKAMDVAPILAGLGGPDVDWCVYSRVDDVARPVSNFWVDDEWDTVRSRGLRSTTRSVGTASE